MNIKLDKSFINNMVIFTPKTKEELQIALKEWCKNKEKAEKKYYHINTWDTSLITDMSELFYSCNNFNDDISIVYSLTSIPKIKMEVLNEQLNNIYNFTGSKSIY